MSDHDKDYDGIKYRQEESPPAVFKILFSVLVVWGVCFMGYYLFSGWSSHAEYDAIVKAKETRLATEKLKGSDAAVVSTSKERKTTNLVAEGKKIFGERCASCHGADAKGGIGPNLTGKQFKFGKSAPEVTKSVIEGRPGGMPSFKNDLSHEQIEGVVQYVLTL
jgi:cytochrome c oxidase cbb3-type subunit III